MGKNRSDIRRHLDAEGGSAMLAIRNIVCHHPVEGGAMQVTNDLGDRDALRAALSDLVAAGAPDQEG